MGVHLVGNGGADFTSPTWKSCLDIAEAFGWKPLKTVAPHNFEGKWSGTYLSHDFQEVTATDARALADALFMAVECVKKHHPLTKKQAKAFEYVDFREVTKLAEFALSGRFLIG